MADLSKSRKPYEVVRQGLDDTPENLKFEPIAGDRKGSALLWTAAVF